MLYLLMDTCSWIDLLAEEKRVNLEVLERLTNEGMIKILRTKEIVDEIKVDPARQIRRFREINEELVLHLDGIRNSFSREARVILDQITSDLKQNERITWISRAAPRMQSLLQGAEELPDSPTVWSNVMRRYQSGSAPFHSDKRRKADKKLSMNDSLVFEKFIEVAMRRDAKDIYVFISSNKNDFIDCSDRGTSRTTETPVAGDHTVQKRKHEPRLHKDLSEGFDGRAVVFHVSLDTILQRHFPEHVRETRKTRTAYAKRRSNADIRTQLGEVVIEESHQRFLRRRQAVADGEMKLVDDGGTTRRMRPDLLTWTKWKTEQAEAERFEKGYRGCVPMRNDYNSGVIAGQAAALRWVLGLSSSAWPAFRTGEEVEHLFPIAG